jgi:DNA primase
MERAGLTIPSKENRSEKSYDRFRGRLMFPITDTAGRVAGFSGRVLIEGVGKTLGASSAAKYVNSPETDVFHKSRVLFGFSFAKEAIRRADTCVIVEGQMDLILSHQAAIINTVASSGTALSTEHLDLIKRFTKNIVLAFDADTAGITAAHRAILLALAHDMSVRIAQLPTGMDPADVIRTDPLVWVQAVNSALPVIDFYLDLIPKLYLDKSTQRAHISTTIIPFIALLKSSIDQGHYVGEISKL